MPERIRVVIADDHEAVRSGIAAILAVADDIVIVGEAENGFDAVALCIEESPDVALVDLRMPGKDGIWATERITAETPCRALVLTTYDSDDLVARALAAGAHGYLLKSVRGAELIDAVRHVAAGRHVLDPVVTGGVIARSGTAPVAPAPELELTEREEQVLALVAEGLSNPGIAAALGIGLTTVKTHIGALYAKTGATSRVTLGRFTGGRG